MTTSLHYRLGGVALIAGSLLILVSFGIHPVIPVQEGVDPYIREIDGTPAWIPLHVGLLVGFLAWFPGLFFLYRAIRDRGGSVYASFGAYALGLAAPLFFVGLVIDSLVAPILVANYTAAFGEVAVEVARAVVNLARLLVLNLLLPALLLISASLGLFGASLIHAKLYPRVLGIVGVVLAVAVLAGYPVGVYGLYLVGTLTYNFVATAGLVWTLVVGIFLYRTPPRASTGH